jgi:hypothetical protein
MQFLARFGNLRVACEGGIFAGKRPVTRICRRLGAPRAWRSRRDGKAHPVPEGSEFYRRNAIFTLE